MITEGGKASLGLLGQERLKKCREFIHICALTEQNVDTALALGWPDLEDASVYVCAEKLKASCIITRDANFPASAIRTLTATAYFDLLKSEEGITYAELTLGVDGV